MFRDNEGNIAANSIHYVAFDNLKKFQNYSKNVTIFICISATSSQLPRNIVYYL